MVNEVLGDVSSVFSWGEGFEFFQRLAIFAIGIIIFSFFVIKYYKFISKREIFDFDLEKYNKATHPILDKIIVVVLYVVEHIILLPSIVLIWYGVLVVMITFLSKSTGIETILLIAASLIASIRVTSYFNQELSAELAKLLPFALLAIFLSDIGQFLLKNSLSAVAEIPSHWEKIVYYIIIIAVIEIFLRICYSVYGMFSINRKWEKN